MTTDRGTKTIGSGLGAWARRDRFFLAGVGLVSFTVLLCSAYADDFWRTWVLPVRSHDVLWVVSWILGAGLGIVLPLREEVLGLREAALHRSVCPQARTRSRLLWSMAILATSIPLAFCAQWGVEAVFGNYVSVAALENALPLGASASVVFVSLTATWFAMQLDTGYVRRVLLAAGLNFGLVALCLALVTGEPRSVSPTALIVFHVAIASVLGASTWFQAPGRHDPDLAPGSMSGRWWTVFAAGGAALVGALGVYELRREALGQYSGSFLRIVEDPNGAVYFGVRTDRDQKTLSPFSLGGANAFSSTPSFASWFGQRNLWIADGRLHIVRRGRDGSTAVWATRRTLAKPDGVGHFSPGTRVWEWRDEKGVSGTPQVHWIVEPGADRLWRLNADETAITAVPLPDGYVVVRGHGHRTVLLSDEHGVRRVFGAANNWLGALEPQPRFDQLSERVVITGDPLAPEVTVTTRAGETWSSPVSTTLKRGYDRSDRRMALATAYTLSAIQSPALAVWSYATGPLPTRPYAQLDPLRDPLLANRRRSGLLLSCFALAGLAGFGAWIYLRRIGAPRPAGRAWTAFCLVTGPLGLLPVLILERPRAYRQLPSVAAPPPRLFTPRSA